MRQWGWIAVLVVWCAPGCFKTPQTSFPEDDAGGGDSGAGGGGGDSGGRGGGGWGGSDVGGCSPACDATHVCTGGRCLLVDAEPCVTGSQCASGACNPFYKDVDGDGYGTGSAVGFCTLTTPPIGYAAQSGDCCDDATNLALAKSIHPGADFQTTSAGGICGGITWDYDCSGTVEKATSTCNGCTAAPDCQCIVDEFADSRCGTTTARNLCFVVNAGPAVQCSGSGSATFTLACR